MIESQGLPQPKRRKRRFEINAAVKAAAEQAAVGAISEADAAALVSALDEAAEAGYRLAASLERANRRADEQLRELRTMREIVQASNEFARSRYFPKSSEDDEVAAVAGPEAAPA